MNNHTKHKNCLVSAVGKNSLHKLWKKGICNYDIHLIVYDDSLDDFYLDADFICHIKGYKLKVIYKYFKKYPCFLDTYDYFFFPDDDIKMDVNTINRLFDTMHHYGLKIAQPSLTMSYPTWSHLLKDKYNKLRYTNFVEMMVPLFSKEALRAVLFTFNENETGWGTEAHWPLLIKATHQDIAVIHEISVVHTRPIQSGQKIHFQELKAYLNKYNLEININLYQSIPLYRENVFCCSQEVFWELRDLLFTWISHGKPTSYFIDDICFLFLFGEISQSQVYNDIAYRLLEKNQYKIEDFLIEVLFGRNSFLSIQPIVKHLQNSLTESFKTMDKQILYYYKSKDILTWKNYAALGVFFLQIGNYKFANHIAYILQKCNIQPESFDDIIAIFDILEVLNGCGITIEDNIIELEQYINAIEFSQLEYAYFLFRIYKLTNEKHLLTCIQEKLKNMPHKLAGMQDAIKLAEMLNFNSLEVTHISFWGVILMLNITMLHKRTI